MEYLFYFPIVIHHSHYKIKTYHRHISGRQCYVHPVRILEFVLAFQCTYACQLIHLVNHIFDGVVSSPIARKQQSTLLFRRTDQYW